MRNRRRDIFFSVWVLAFPLWVSAQARVPASNRLAAQEADHLFAAMQYEEALPLYHRAAESGNAHACLRIGVYYENGYVVKRDYAEAMRWYRKADGLGDITAATSIGEMYHTGAGVPANLQEAFRWYQKSAAAGDPDGMNHLGVLYSDGDAISQDIPKALEWFHRAADAGNAAAMLNLGNMYYGQSMLKDYAQSMQWYQKSAALGDSRAAANVGAMYERGMGVPRNQAEAIRWYAKAAAMGNQDAVDTLHNLDPTRPTITPLPGGGPNRAPTAPGFVKDEPFAYDFNGEWRVAYPPSAPRHPLFSVVCIHRNTDFQLIVGDPNIYFPMGESMFNGHYVPNQNNHAIAGDLMDAPAHRGAGYRGFAWSKAEIQIVDANHLLLPGGVTLTRIVELGANKLCEPAKYIHLPHAAAFFFIYANKDFELKNFGNAACWLYLSASQGHHEAQRQLALLLHYGTGVRQDDEQSFIWLKKSADQGNKKAERLLSDYYRLGIGVPKNNWLAQASLERANSRTSEPDLPQPPVSLQEQFARSIESSVCGAPEQLRAEHSQRVKAYRENDPNGNGSDAEDRATTDELDAQFWCNSMHAYQPPPMPPKP